MTTTAIRIACAEACGWQRCRIPMQSKHDPEPRGWALNGKAGWSAVSRPPDFPNDLNACAQFEATLTDEEYHAFTLRLSEISWREHPNQTDDKAYKSRLRASFSASPNSRCEAFLKVKGLWRPGGGEGGA